MHWPGPALRIWGLLADMAHVLQSLRWRKTLQGGLWDICSRRMCVVSSLWFFWPRHSSYQSASEIRLELGAQVLTKLAGEMWLAVGAAYKAGDAKGVAQHGGRLLQLLLDMDALLASVP